MISLEKLKILIPLQKLTQNGEDWGKLIVAKGFKKFPKVQKIAQSGHTARIVRVATPARFNDILNQTKITFQKFVLSSTFKNLAR